MRQFHPMETLCEFSLVNVTEPHWENYLKNWSHHLGPLCILLSIVFNFSANSRQRFIASKFDAEHYSRTYTISHNFAAANESKIRWFFFCISFSCLHFTWVKSKNTYARQCAYAHTTRREGVHRKKRRKKTVLRFAYDVRECASRLFVSDSGNEWERGSARVLSMYCVENRFITAQMRATQIQRKMKMCWQSVVSSEQSVAFGVDEHTPNGTGKYYWKRNSEVDSKTVAFNRHSSRLGCLQAEFSICRCMSACLCAECRVFNVHSNRVRLLV